MQQAADGWLLCQHLISNYNTEPENKIRMQMGCPDGHSRLPDDTLSWKEVERIQQFTKRHLGSVHDGNTIKAICDKHLFHIVVNKPPAETSPNDTFVVSLGHHPKALPERER